jgi:sugar phosphate isomerase/epimerase
MRLAYSTLACPRWTVEEAVAAAVRYGYDAIEWRLADGAIIEPDTAPAVRRRLREVSAANGIALACLDTSYGIVQASPEERVAVTEAVQRMIDMADELGAPLLRVFGGPLPRGTTRSLLLAPTAEVLHTICTYAAERNITVVLETHDAWSTSADVLQLLQAAASPSARVLWDIHHTYRAGEVPAQSVALLGTALVHVKDGRPRSNSPETWELCLLNEGTVPLREACSALRHSGYDGYLSLEWEKQWHPEIPEPETALLQAAPLLRRFWHAADWQRARVLVRHAQ